MKKLSLPPLGALRAFHAVAYHSSFKHAGENLNVSPTAISHQIKLLESILGCRVCERNARSVILTEEGKILYSGTQRAFAALEQAVEKIAQSRHPPALTISTTSNFLTNWLLPELADFRATFPAIDLRLHTSVDRIDLTQNNVDIAIRYREMREVHLHSTLLFEDRFIAVASPMLKLEKIDDLCKLTLLHVEDRRVPADSPTWEKWQRRFGPTNVNVKSGLTFNDETHAIQAAIAGQGVVLASKLLARDLLQRGVLIAPFPMSLSGGNYYFVTTKESALRPDIVALRQWLMSKIGQYD